MTKIHPQIRARAKDLRRAMTPQERRLWAKLREINRMLGTHFRRQAPVGTFIADFADFTQHLVIEVDGGQHGVASDITRESWLRSQGFAVLRFWNNDVDQNIEGVMQSILDTIESRFPANSKDPQ